MSPKNPVPLSLLRIAGVSLVAVCALANAVPALAQSQVIDPRAARQANNAASAQPLVQGESSPDNRAAPLAAGRKESHRILSRTEIENRQRAAEGRFGRRLGDDMGFRIDGRQGG